MTNPAHSVRLAAALTFAAAAALAPSPAQAAGPRTVCVGSAPPCVPTLSAAMAAARDGDTVRVDPGVYRGGITIKKSIQLVGAGAGRTVIDGGGPVVRVARATDPAGLRSRDSPSRAAAQRETDTSPVAVASTSLQGPRVASAPRSG